MTDGSLPNPATHFGRQVRKARREHGWSVHELARRSGISAGHLSHLETGTRNPTERIAERLDKTFPERKQWFWEYYRDSQEWTPPGYRHWAEYEDRATLVRCWVGGVIHGLAQTPEYARAHLLTVPGVPSEIVEKRLQARMERQKRLYERGIPVVHLVDLLSMYRDIGGAEVMAAQCDRLIELGTMPDVQVLVIPAVGHAGTAAGITVTDNAAYTEHAYGGYVYTDETGIDLRRFVDTLQSESYRASESAGIIGRMRDLWARGESPASAAIRAETA